MSFPIRVQSVCRDYQQTKVATRTPRWSVKFEQHSRFRPRFTRIHPNLRQMVKSRCIGMEIKRVQHQYGVSRCSYGVCMIRLRIHCDSLRQRYNSPWWSYECSQCHGASIIKAGSVTTSHECGRFSGCHVSVRQIMAPI